MSTSRPSSPPRHVSRAQDPAHAEHECPHPIEQPLLLLFSLQFPSWGGSPLARCLRTLSVGHSCRLRGSPMGRFCCVTALLSRPGAHGCCSQMACEGSNMPPTRGLPVGTAGTHARATNWTLFMTSTHSLGRLPKGQGVCPPAGVGGGVLPCSPVSSFPSAPQCPVPLGLILAHTVHCQCQLTHQGSVEPFSVATQASRQSGTTRTERAAGRGL